MLNLFVLDAQSAHVIPACIETATAEDLIGTSEWQSNWTTEAVSQMPNKVALRRADTRELLGLMSYEVDYNRLAVEIIYFESAKHSNANMLRQEGKQKRYLGIAKAMLAHAIEISVQEGFYGIVLLRAKTTSLLEYYHREFGARRAGAYDPFLLIIWEDAAEKIIAEFKDGDLDG